MTAKEFASLLDGREYGNEITKEETDAAKAAGLVVVFGASDDLIEFRGAIDDEGDCYDGGAISFNRTGILRYISPGDPVINAIWCGDSDEEAWSWAYGTSIPHETFGIYEDGEKYCRGIVFSVEDLKPKEKYSAEEKERKFEALHRVVKRFLIGDVRDDLLQFIEDIKEECAHE